MHTYSPIEVIHYYYGESKPGFMRSEDTYTHWVMLTAQEGRFQYAMESERGEAGPGQVLICPPGVTLQRKAISENLSFHFAEWKWMTAIEGSSFIRGAIDIADEPRLLSNYSYLKQLSPRMGGAQSQQMGHYVYDIVLLCIQSSGLLRDPRKQIDPVASQIAEYLRQHACEPIKLEDVAASFGIPPYQLTRRFKAAYAKTPIQYLVSARLHHIKELLIETDHTIEHIAQLSGFQNGFYLSRVFTEKTGMNPSDFRKTHRV